MGNEGKYFLCAHTKGRPSKKWPNVELRWPKPMPIEEAMALYCLLESNGFSCWLEGADGRDKVSDPALRQETGE